MTIIGPGYWEDRKVSEELGLTPASASPIATQETERPVWLLMKRGLYERPDHRGYTGLRADAGRFTAEECRKIEAVSGGEVSRIHQDDAPPLAPRADRGTFAEVLAQRLDEANAALSASEKRNEELVRDFAEGVEIGRRTSQALADTEVELATSEALVTSLKAEVEELKADRDVATKPLKDTVNRILDEHSAWIAQPNPEVASRIAFAAAVAVSLQFETRPDPELYVPGEFQCAKCGFTLSQFRMRADDGAIGSRDHPGERCPNDGAPLWRVTWKQRAVDHYERASEEIQSRTAAEARLASLTGLVGDMREKAAKVKRWLRDYIEADLDEIAADGGVTVGMIFQKDAESPAAYMDDILRALELPAPAVSTTGEEA